MKIAITTVLDNKYLPGFLVTFNSMLRVSKNLNYDLIILEWGDLSDENKALIKTLYPNTIFRMVDKESYATHDYDTTWRTWTYNCNYRFDIFTYTDYDRVIFFDCDFLFQIDIAEVANIDVDFGAAPASYRQVHQINREIGFEGGLLSIGKKYLNNETKQALLNIANSPPPPDATIKTGKWASDEPILNTYFLDKITWLPAKYNLAIDKLTRDHFKTPHNYQFVGHNKPWYGKEIADQFDNFISETIIKTSGKFMPNILLKKMLHLYNLEVEDLKSKGIDVNKYAGGIKPRKG